jgi:hypothetical protein
MMQLVSQHNEIERPSNFDIACRLLRDNLRECCGKYELWTHGRWVGAHIDDIMLRANQLLKSTGRPQMAGKACWVAV